MESSGIGGLSSSPGLADPRCVCKGRGGSCRLLGEGGGPRDVLGAALRGRGLREQGPETPAFLMFSKVTVYEVQTPPPRTVRPRALTLSPQSSALTATVAQSRLAVSLGRALPPASLRTWQRSPPPRPISPCPSVPVLAMGPYYPSPHPRSPLRPFCLPRATLLQRRRLSAGEVCHVPPRPLLPNLVSAPVSPPHSSPLPDLPNRPAEPPHSRWRCPHPHPARA